MQFWSGTDSPGSSGSSNSMATRRSLEVPDHATARLLQRAPSVNLPRVLTEAQDQFFAADVATVSRHVAHGTSLYLRCDPGLLICEAISGVTPSKINFLVCEGPDLDF
jgi:hypothetical protein